jgi:hypothetical protein
MRKYEYYAKNYQLFEQLEGLRKIQENCIDNSDYMRGLYNGICICISVVSGTDPNFINEDFSFEKKKNKFLE